MGDDTDRSDYTDDETKSGNDSVSTNKQRTQQGDQLLNMVIHSFYAMFTFYIIYHLQHFH